MKCTLATCFWKLIKCLFHQQNCLRTMGEDFICYRYYLFFDRVTHVKSCYMFSSSFVEPFPQRYIFPSVRLKFALDEKKRSHKPETAEMNADDETRVMGLFSSGTFRHLKKDWTSSKQRQNDCKKSVWFSASMAARPPMKPVSTGTFLNGDALKKLVHLSELASSDAISSSQNESLGQTTSLGLPHCMMHMFKRPNPMLSTASCFQSGKFG